MPKYIVDGDERHPLRPKSDSPLDIANELRDTCWTPSDSLEHFMQQQARATWNYARKRIRTDSVENFVADLLKIEFIKKVE